MNLAAWVEKWGRAAPDRPAISLGGATYSTYRQWAERSRVLAGNLRRLCHPEERVAIAMTNRPEFLEALFAIWHAGLVAVPMNAKLHGEEFGYIIRHTDAALVLASPDRAEDVAPHGRTVATGSAEWLRLYQGDGIDLVPRQPDDLAWLFYTSGTTGRPKGAMLTHRNPAWRMRLSYFADIDPIAPADAKLACRAAVARLRRSTACRTSPRAPAISCRRAAASIRTRSSRSCPPSPACQLLRGADHGQAGWSSTRALPHARPSRPADDRLWRCADVSRGPAPRMDLLGPARADLRPGRSRR